MVVTGRYTESLFAGYGNATVTAINEFGCRRGYLEPITFVGQDLNLDEQAKVVCAYSALIGSKYRAPSGTVSSLAWEWGIYKTDTVRNMYYKFKYGQSIFSPRGQSVQDKVMDVLANHEAVVRIIKKKDR
jgi:hypothetical protein